MENKVLETNINRIREYDLKLADEILMFEYDKSTFSLCKTACDEYNIVFNGIPLHDNNSAIEEAKMIASKIEDKDDSIRIIYGFGLGYLLDEIAKKIKKGKIILFEPNLELLNFVFSIAEIDSIYNQNVVICSNEDTFLRHIQENISDKTEISITFLNSYKNLYLEDIKKKLEFAQKVQGELIGNKNTFLKKAPRAILNTISNLKNILKNPSISQLKDIYKGKTAIILCAGPSLKDNIEFIKENQDKFVIFALNPVVKMLVSKGIKPDFIVNIETINTIAQFSTIDTKQYYFILESFCSSVVSNIKTKNTFNYISKTNFINDWLREILDIDDIAESLGTVSYSALVSAFIMGFEKIIITGQDLAYKDGNCYAKGSQYENLECIWLEEEKKYVVIANDFDAFAKSLENKQINFKKAKIMAQRYIDFMNNNLITVKSQDGKFIPTKTDYAIFIKCFEDIAKRIKELNPNIRLINSSSGGAQIDGFENVPLEKLLVGLEKVEKLDLTGIKPQYNKEKVRDKTGKLLNGLILFKTIIEDFIHINSNLIKELEIKKIYTPNFEKMLVKYKEVLSYILKQENNEQINFVILVHLHDLLDCITNESFKDEKATLETLNNTLEKAERLERYLTSHIKGLNDCKPFVLE